MHLNMAGLWGRRLPMEQSGGQHGVVGPHTCGQWLQTLPVAVAPTNPCTRSTGHHPGHWAPHLHLLLSSLLSISGLPGDFSTSPALPESEMIKQGKTLFLAAPPKLKEPQGPRFVHSSWRPAQEWLGEEKFSPALFKLPLPRRLSYSWKPLLFPTSHF